MTDLDLLSNDGWIEESPYAAVVLPGELGQVCCWCFRICWSSSLSNGNQPAGIDKHKNLGFKRCSGCKLNAYCGVDCQKLDWKEDFGCHKSECSALRMCGDYRYSAKINVYVRLVGRLLRREQHDINRTASNISYGATLSPIEKLYMETEAQARLHKLSTYKKDQQNFLASFYQLYDSNSKLPQWQINGLHVQNAYDICRIYGRNIVHFDVMRGGPRVVGLGLFINFMSFKHSCTASLITSIESKPGQRVSLKAKLNPSLTKHSRQVLLNDVALNGPEELTISCLEHCPLLETFGTWFPSQNLVEQYLQTNCLTNECNCGLCSTNLTLREKQSTLSRFTLRCDCPEIVCKSERLSCIISGLCDCDFLSVNEMDVLGSKRAAPFWPTSTGSRNPDCEVCTTSSVHPSVRAKCLCCNSIFEYTPHLPFDPTGPPAIMQLLQRMYLQIKDTDQLLVRFECPNQLLVLDPHQRFGRNLLAGYEQQIVATILNICSHENLGVDPVIDYDNLSIVDHSAVLATSCCAVSLCYQHSFDYNIIAMLYYAKFLDDRCSKTINLNPEKYINEIVDSNLKNSSWNQLYRSLLQSLKDLGWGQTYCKMVHDFKFLIQPQLNEMFMQGFEGLMTCGLLPLIIQYSQTFVNQISWSTMLNIVLGGKQQVLSTLLMILQELEWKEMVTKILQRLKGIQFHALIKNLMQHLNYDEQHPLTKTVLQNFRIENWNQIEGNILQDFKNSGCELYYRDFFLKVDSNMINQIVNQLLTDTRDQSYRKVMQHIEAAGWRRFCERLIERFKVIECDPALFTAACLGWGNIQLDRMFLKQIVDPVDFGLDDVCNKILLDLVNTVGKCPTVSRIFGNFKDVCDRGLEDLKAMDWSPIKENLLQLLRNSEWDRACCKLLLDLQAAGWGVKLYTLLQDATNLGLDQLINKLMDQVERLPINLIFGKILNSSNLLHLDKLMRNVLKDLENVSSDRASYLHLIEFYEVAWNLLYTRVQEGVTHDGWGAIYRKVLRAHHHSAIYANRVACQNEKLMRMNNDG